MEERLFQSFRIGFWLHLTFVVILCVVIIILFAFKGKISADTEHNGKLVFWIGLCLLIIVLVIVSVRFVNYCLDITYVKNGNYETFVGEVIGYTYIAEGNSPQDPILGHPIFRDIATNEEKRFIVGPCEIGEIYTIIYLPHTKLAEIIAP